MANEHARALRRQRTPAERKLWWRLRDMKAHGFKFRQQAPIDGFIVDFVCLSARLIIEVDGGTHSTEDELAADIRRQLYLEGQQFRVLRVTNVEVFDSIDTVMDVIVQHLEAGSPPPPTPPRKGEGSDG